MPQGPDNSGNSDPGQSPNAHRLAAGVGGPAVLGEFELGEVIGRGGMGTVYSAWQRSLHRTVALKVLGQHISASANSIRRFQREAQAAAKLTHTNIIPIFAQGEQDGVYYYAMELMAGPGLNALIADAAKKERAAGVADSDETVLLDRSSLNRPKSADGAQAVVIYAKESATGARSARIPDEYKTPTHFATVARHIAAVADALQYAHEQGVIHRDIKPHNLIMGADGRLHISDFGLARVAEQPGVTMTGELIGSPLYMAPEQITEGPANVDHRADIYALGATMYEWLTLSPPYPGETRERVISRILGSEPLPVRAHNPSVPVDLETICLKAIERDRGRRFQSAAEFRDDLERYLKSKPIKAKRSGIPTRAMRLVVRHQVATVVALAGVLALSLASALYFTRREAKSQTAAAQHQARQLIEEKQKADDFIEQLTALAPLEIMAPLRAVEAARPMFEQAARPVLEDILGKGTKRSAQTGEGPAREPDSARVNNPEGIARRAIRDLYLDFAPRRWPSARRARECGPERLSTVTLGESNAAGGRQLVERCLAVQPDHREARALHAALCGQMGQFDTMANDARQMIGLPGFAALGRVWLGLAHLLLGDSSESIDELALASAQSGGNALISAWAHTLRGLALVRLERAQEALAEFNGVLAVEPGQAVALLGRSCARAADGDMSGAVGDLDGIITLEPRNADAIALRGEHHLRLGNVDAALADFRGAVDIGGKTSTLTMYIMSALLLQKNASDGTKTESLPPNDSDAEPDDEQSSRRRIIDRLSGLAGPGTQDGVHRTLSANYTAPLLGN